VFGLDVVFVHGSVHGGLCLSEDGRLNQRMDVLRDVVRLDD